MSGSKKVIGAILACVASVAFLLAGFGIGKGQGGWEGVLSIAISMGALGMVLVGTEE